MQSVHFRMQAAAQHYTAQRFHCLKKVLTQAGCVQAVIMRQSPKDLGCQLWPAYEHTLRKGLECPSWDCMEQFAVSTFCSC